MYHMFLYGYASSSTENLSCKIIAQNFLLNISFWLIWVAFTVFGVFMVLWLTQWPRGTSIVVPRIVCCVCDWRLKDDLGIMQLADGQTSVLQQLHSNYIQRSVAGHLHRPIELLGRTGEAKVLRRLNYRMQLVLFVDWLYWCGKSVLSYLCYCCSTLLIVVQLRSSNQSQNQRPCRTVVLSMILHHQVLQNLNQLGFIRYFREHSPAKLDA